MKCHRGEVFLAIRQLLKATDNIEFFNVRKTEYKCTTHCRFLLKDLVFGKITLLFHLTVIHYFGILCPNKIPLSLLFWLTKMWKTVFVALLSLAKTVMGFKAFSYFIRREAKGYFLACSVNFLRVSIKEFR